jgi:FtsZ-interacting cell division protein ZipA
VFEEDFVIITAFVAIVGLLVFGLWDLLFRAYKDDGKDV